MYTNEWRAPLRQGSADCESIPHEACHPPTRRQPGGWLGGEVQSKERHDRFRAGYTGRNHFVGVLRCSITDFSPLTTSGRTAATSLLKLRRISIADDGDSHVNVASRWPRITSLGLSRSSTSRHQPWAWAVDRSRDSERPQSPRKPLHGICPPPKPAIRRAWGRERSHHGAN